MRLIAAVRLSKMTEVTTSVDTQTENLEDFARRNGHTIVAVTEDLDVSGGKPVRERPGVGPWFKRLDEWDGVLGYAIDRMFRDHYDFVTTWHDIFEPNNKKLIAVSEDIDMTTDAGELSMHMRVMFAQQELRKIRERNTRKAHKLITSGYSNGGRSSQYWAYRPQKDGVHFILVPDPEVVPVVHEIIQALFDGSSVRQEALRLGVDPTTLAARLRSPTLKGWYMYKGEPVRDTETGEPLRREPIIGDTLWARLQECLHAKSRGAGTPKNATPWFGVLYCGPCGEKLYRGAGRPSRKLRPPYTPAQYYWYYRHRSSVGPVSCKTNVSAPRVDEQITPLILRAFQDVYLPDIVKEPAIRHTDELVRIEQTIKDLENNFVEKGGSMDQLVRLTAKLAAKAAQLRNEERPARTSIRSTDELVTERWQSLPTDNKRGALLRKIGIRLYVTPVGGSDAVLRGQYGSEDWHVVLDRLREHGKLVGDPID